MGLGRTFILDSPWDASGAICKKYYFYDILIYEQRHRGVSCGQSAISVTNWSLLIGYNLPVKEASIGELISDEL